MPEEVFKHLIESLKSTPMILALLTFNLVFLGLVSYVTLSAQSNWKELIESILKACKEGI